MAASRAVRATFNDDERAPLWEHGYMAELIALYMAGLAFFFTGITDVSDNLQRLSGHRFRLLLSRATHRPLRAGLLGAAMGAVTQSTSVVAVILGGMTASGLLQLRRALLVLACSNIGTALLVFITVLNLHLPTLFLIGVSGLILAFKLFHKWKPAWGALLAIGLIFFGLDVMKQAFKPLAGTPGFTSVGAFFDYWPDAAFFVGMLMRTVVHSSSAAAAVTITLNHGATLDEFPSMLSIAGLGAGTALATYLLSSNLRGIPRQIALFQAAGNILAAIVVAGMLLLEHATGAPMIMALLRHMSSTVSGRMAFMYFLFNVAILLVSLALLPWAQRWLERLCPPTLEQDLSRPMYLETATLHAPETALDLVAMEQLRMVRALRHSLDAARGNRAIELSAVHESAQTLGEAISQFMAALVSMRIATSLAARVISFQRKQEMLRALEENIFLFAQTMRGMDPLPETATELVEALDMLTTSTADAMAGEGPIDLDMLVSMTEDRGPMMENLRSGITVEEGGVGSIAALHYATTLFERNVWLLRQIAQWKREDIARSAA